MAICSLKKDKKLIINKLYRHNLTLLTDLYQLTMAYGYWQNGLYDREAVFHLFYRKAPFGGEYAITAGLQLVVEYLQNLQFSVTDIQYLAGLKGADGQPLFDESFLNHLQRLDFKCDIDALPEGTICYPHQPLIRVRGPLLQAQLIETALLNLVNFSTLIATKAARVVQAAQGDTVLEFGLRRAQGIDGGLTASRAAYIGGCHATSNVLAGKLYGIPVRGTHAHSWVMVYDSELEAFAHYAEAMPNNCIFLVDTYDTEEGVKNAIRVGQQLRKRGYEMNGIRLDSGDLVALSRQARKLLDEAGFAEAKIVASDGLDEYKIAQLKEAGAQIDVWGVGTKLATAYEQAALGGVYKLAAIRNEQGEWEDRIKLSNTPIKVSHPGQQQVRRLYVGDRPVGDVIYDENQSPTKEITYQSFGEKTTRTANFELGKDLLEPIFRAGKLVYDLPQLNKIRTRTIEQVALFSSLKDYPNGLEMGLKKRKDQLVKNAIGVAFKH